MIYTYLYNGETHTIRLEHEADGHFTATIGERRFPVAAQPLRDGGWLLTIGEQRFTAYGAANGHQRSVHVGGQEYNLHVPDVSEKRRATRAGGDLTAQMPGQVADVLVTEGEAVQTGQTLVILEAMKMEIRVTAPHDGRVRRVLVRKGQVVERGQVIAELEGE
jgi:biotin carboxyl carrier protein